MRTYRLTIEGDHNINKVIKGLKMTEVKIGQSTVFVKKVKGDLKGYYFRQNKVYCYSYRTKDRKVIGTNGYITGEQ